MSAKAFLEGLVAVNRSNAAFFRLIAVYLGIPYLEERENDLEGQENWPDSCNTIEKAFQKLGQPQAMWYHHPSMNLVILDETKKVGIRSICFQATGFRGMDQEKAGKTIDELRKKKRVLH